MTSRNNRNTLLSYYLVENDLTLHPLEAVIVPRFFDHRWDTFLMSAHNVAGLLQQQCDETVSPFMGDLEKSGLWRHHGGDRWSMDPDVRERCMEWAQGMDEDLAFNGLHIPELSMTPVLTGHRGRRGTPPIDALFGTTSADVALYNDLEPDELCAETSITHPVQLVAFQSSLPYPRATWHAVMAKVALTWDFDTGVASLHEEELTKLLCQDNSTTVPTLVHKLRTQGHWSIRRRRSYYHFAFAPLGAASAFNYMTSH